MQEPPKDIQSCPFPRYGRPSEPPLPTYDEFYHNHLEPAIPCILYCPLQPAFEECTEVVSNVSTGSPSDTSISASVPLRNVRIPRYNEIAHLYGSYPVLATNNETTQPLSTFLDHMKSGDGTTYLKDWHFVLQHRKHLLDEGNLSGRTWLPYRVPIWFGDDWLNEFYDQTSNEDDYRFVYMGASGTYTPLHCDILTTHSWSANLCGVKKWTFFPPSQAPYFSSPPGALIEDLRCITPETCPSFYTHTTPIVIYQNEGEILFVPSGWYHQVENIGPTLSMNHNWCNASNLPSICECLLKDLREIERAIGEHKEEMGEVEWENHCQVLLKANNSGWGLEQFWQFLQVHAERLTKLLNEKANPQIMADSELLRKPWTGSVYAILSAKQLLSVWEKVTGEKWCQRQIASGTLQLTEFRLLEECLRAIPSTG
ncbi:hypothetical protein DFS34DRAFT_620601 [Phlyctochytrium arcticum]|nr:hypothetical protein DFS34DRAFT_620601 [Phlyctochytrium arcticum]